MMMSYNFKTKGSYFNLLMAKIPTATKKMAPITTNVIPRIGFSETKKVKVLKRIQNYYVVPIRSLWNAVGTVECIVCET